MVFTRSRKELVKLSDITYRLKKLTDKFDNFSKKYEELVRFSCYQKMQLSVIFSYRLIRKERCA